jgi:basic membrane protein A and related proteins
VSRDPQALGAFDDWRAAKKRAAGLIRQGADIILPVDGTTGTSASCSAAERSPRVLLIGIDTDQFFSTPECSTRWLTSVLKIYRQMVFLAMGQVVDHRFQGGRLERTLANGGVGLASFHSLRARVPAGLRNELRRVKRDIVRRSASIDPRDYGSG